MSWTGMDLPIRIPSIAHNYHDKRIQKTTSTSHKQVRAKIKPQKKEKKTNKLDQQQSKKVFILLRFSPSSPLHISSVSPLHPP